MKKIILALAVLAAALTLSSCNNYDLEKTATVNLAGDWVCVIYYEDEGEWVADSGLELVTYNTSENIPTEMWINDYESYWGTLCKVDCDADNYTFGTKDKEYEDQYNGVNQHIYGGKVTVAGAKAPGSGTVVDKIEFFIEFEDDEEPYCYTYYVAGYRRTGFPEDDENYIVEWDSMPNI